MREEIAAERVRDAEETAKAAREAGIRTSYVKPPIPTTAFDWSAVRDGYEPGDHIGRGETEQAAIDDLIEQEDE